MPDFLGRLKSGANKVAFEADKLARTNRAQGEADRLKAQINSQYTKLGEAIYQKFVNLDAIDPSLTEACQAIADLQKQVEAKTEEVAKIKAETFGETAPAEEPAPEAASEPEPAAAPEAKHCPNCGKAVEAEEKFCKECGTKLA